jgi:hypothetical protein
MVDSLSSLLLTVSTKVSATVRPRGEQGFILVPELRRLIISSILFYSKNCNF